MSYKKTFKQVATGMALAIGLTLIPSFKNAANSQIPLDPWTPQLGTERYDLLQDHVDFIKKMRLKNKSVHCCNLEDAQPNLKEEINQGADKEEFPYIVTITHDLNGKKLPEPQKIKIPKDRILSVERANEVCDPIMDLNPNSTCEAPPYNILWAFDNSKLSNYRSGKTPWSITTIYCYFPKPQLN